MSNSFRPMMNWSALLVILAALSQGCTEVEQPLEPGPTSDITVDGDGESGDGPDDGPEDPTQGGSGLVASTYMGGPWEEAIRDIAVDGQGNIYVVGGTESGSHFPTTSGAYQRSPRSGPRESGVTPMDAFVVKFDRNGNPLWSTLLGGPNYDRAYGVDVDAQGNVYVAGRAGAGFPVTAGAFQTSFRGGTEASFYGKQDGFICKLKPTGSGLVFCSYFGTGDPRIVRDVAVDGGGNIYIASGWSSGSYPSAVAGRFTNGRKGGEDAVVAKVRGDGAAVIWARYAGGSGWEGNQNSIGLDGAGNPYLLFTTKSGGIATGSAYDRSYGGGGDLFVTRLSPSTGGVVWGTYLGGSRNESTETHELAVDAAGNVYVAAPTQSTNYPTTQGAFRRTFAGGANDIFVSKLSSDGARLVASTLLGGSGSDRPEGVDVDASGNVYFTGTTTSANFPLTPNAHQRSLRSGRAAIGVILNSNFSSLRYSTFIGGGSSDWGRAAAVSAIGDFVIGGQTGGPGWPTVNAFQSSFLGGSSDAVLTIIGP